MIRRMGSEAGSLASTGVVMTLNACMGVRRALDEQANDTRRLMKFLSIEEIDGDWRITNIEVSLLYFKRCLDENLSWWGSGATHDDWHKLMQAMWVLHLWLWTKANNKKEAPASLHIN